jgi:catechol 2,3-dioxygenase-like lactoylglutathione lyase family enzyme
VTVIPPRLSVVTIGVREMSLMRSFYTGLGWAEQPEASDQWCAYLLGGTVLALYAIDDLAAEAAPGEPLTKHGWGGHTLALNVEARDDVDEVVRALVAAGARKVGQVTDRPWGGRSGYVADPEGNRWEIAWAPGLRFDERGAVLGWPTPDG